MDYALYYLLGEIMINDRLMRSISNYYISDILNGFLLCMVLFFSIEYSIFPQGGMIKLYFCIALCITSFATYKIRVYDIKDVAVLGMVVVLVLLACRAQIIASGFSMYKMSLTLQFCLTIFSVFFLCQTGASHLTEILKVVLFFGVIYAACIDVFYISSGTSLANKFTCSYLHLYLLVIYASVRQNKKRASLFLLTFVVFIICCMYKCSTASIACIIFIMLVTFWDVIYCYLLSPIVATAILFISDTVLLLGSNILKSKWVNYLIVDVLGKDLSLTGRTGIYSSAVEKYHLYYKGVGLDNNHLASLVITNGGPNLQNGLLDITLSLSWFGVVALICLLIFALLCAGRSIYGSEAFVCCIYSFIFISCVEIVFDQLFISFLILIIYFIPRAMEGKNEI